RIGKGDLRGAYAGRALKLTTIYHVQIEAIAMKLRALGLLHDLLFLGSLMRYSSLRHHVQGNIGSRDSCLLPGLGSRKLNPVNVIAQLRRLDLVIATECQNNSPRAPPRSRRPAGFPSHPATEPSAARLILLAECETRIRGVKLGSSQPLDHRVHSA